MTDHTSKKFAGMLFCTDLDGTFFAAGGKVLQQNLDAIEYFKSQGGLFTFITGRVPQTSANICRIIQPNAPYGCINGGGIYDHHEGKYLWRMHLPAEAIELVREVDEKLPGIGIQFNTEKAIYFNKDNLTMERFRRNTGMPNIACHYEDVKEPVLKVLFGHHENEQILALQELLHSHPKAHLFDFIRSEHALYEILPKGASKGGALRKMAELSGIDPAKTIAVGDYNNDISMLREAGLSFAVANAVDEAKAAADHITVSNNDGAIAAIIDQLDRGEIML